MAANTKHTPTTAGRAKGSVAPAIDAAGAPDDTGAGGTPALSSEDAGTAPGRPARAAGPAAAAAEGTEGGALAGGEPSLADQRVAREFAQSRYAARGR